MRTNNPDKAPAKSRHIDLRVDQHTYDTIANYADYMGISVSEYIRQMLAKGKVVAKEYRILNPETLNRVLFHLGHVGGNLNQIACHLNNGGAMTKDTLRDVDKATSDIFDIKKEIIKLGGDLLGDS